MPSDPLFGQHLFEEIYKSLEDLTRRLLAHIRSTFYKHNSWGKKYCTKLNTEQSIISKQSLLILTVHQIYHIVRIQKMSSFIYFCSTRAPMIGQCWKKTPTLRNCIHRLSNMSVFIFFKLNSIV